MQEEKVLNVNEFMAIDESIDIDKEYQEEINPEDQKVKLEEVGQLFGVTRERIRQIEAKALRKLRHPNRSKRLREYVEN